MPEGATGGLCNWKYLGDLQKMIGRLNHVAIAVPDLEAATAIYRDTLGAHVSQATRQPDHGVTTVFIELPNTKIELLEPLGENSPIAKFLEKNPNGGMHHVCYEVDDILYARDRLVDKGARVLGGRRTEDRPPMASRSCSFTEGLCRHVDGTGTGLKSAAQSGEDDRWAS